MVQPVRSIVTETEHSHHSGFLHHFHDKEGKHRMIIPTEDNNTPSTLAPAPGPTWQELAAAAGWTHEVTGAESAVKADVAATIPVVEQDAKDAETLAKEAIADGRLESGKVIKFIDGVTELHLPDGSVRTVEGDFAEVATKLAHLFGF
jgi:hypothetical protein